MSYEFTSRVRYSEIGPDGRLTLSGLVNYLQDCAVFHSESIGYGPEVWARRQASWIITSWQIVINEFPKLAEEVTTKTWSYFLAGMEGRRNFTIRGSDGRLIAYVDSKWFFFDMQKQRPVHIPQAEIDGYGIEEKLEMESAPRRILLPEDCAVRRTFKVRPTHLDTNRHVNNEQYISMAAGYLPLGFVTHELRVIYHRQAKLGDIICPKVGRTGKGYVVSLDNEEGIPYAIAEFIQKTQEEEADAAASV